MWGISCAPATTMMVIDEVAYNVPTIHKKCFIHRVPLYSAWTLIATMVWIDRNDAMVRKLCTAVHALQNFPELLASQNNS